MGDPSGDPAMKPDMQPSNVSAEGFLAEVGIHCTDSFCILPHQHCRKKLQPETGLEKAKKVMAEMEKAA